MHLIRFEMWKLFQLIEMCAKMAEVERHKGVVPDGQPPTVTFSVLAHSSRFPIT